MKLEEAKMIFGKYFKDGPGKDFVMSVMDSIEIAPAQETTPQPTKEEIELLNKIGEENDYKEQCKQDYKQQHTKPKQAPKKPKICNNCGKEYLPNSGVQKICPECKKLFADIKATAKELAKGEA